MATVVLRMLESVTVGFGNIHSACKVHFSLYTMETYHVQFSLHVLQQSNKHGDVFNNGAVGNRDERREQCVFANILVICS
jgi:hypothetical protein